MPLFQVCGNQKRKQIDKGRADGETQGGIKLKFELTNNNEPKTENDTPMVWVRWYEEVKDNGEYILVVDRISFKDDGQPVFFAVNVAENQGISIFAAHHPTAKFTDATPHGVRLANAIGRTFKIEGEVSADDICSAVKESKKQVSISVKKTDKGILWSVILSKKNKA